MSRKPRPPGSRRRRNQQPEDRLVHEPAAQFLAVALPPDWEWQTVDSGGKRTKVEAARLKAKGLRPGWPDLVIVPPHSWGPHLYVEFKAPGKAAATSQEQDDRHARLRRLGQVVLVCDSVEQLELQLRRLEVPLRATTGIALQGHRVAKVQHLGVVS